MKLWLLKARDDIKNIEDSNLNPWEPWFDQNFGYVVRAETEYMARQLASNDGGERVEDPALSKEEADGWLNSKYSTCIELTADGPEKIILINYENV